MEAESKCSKHYIPNFADGSKLHKSEWSGKTMSAHAIISSE